MIPLPTERAMGLVTLLSGLAVPLAFLTGSRLIFAVETTSAKVFDTAVWIINPFGVLFYKFALPLGMWPTIGLYILGSMLSALLWGLIDGFIRARKSAD